MATNKNNDTAKEVEYEPKAQISKIQATSRASLKLRDNYFTIEYTEERIVPDLKDVDIDKEREALWGAVNKQCEDQADLIYRVFNGEEQGT